MPSHHDKVQRRRRGALRAWCNLFSNAPVLNEHFIVSNPTMIPRVRDCLQIRERIHVNQPRDFTHSIAKARPATADDAFPLHHSYQPQITCLMNRGNHLSASCKCHDAASPQCHFHLRCTGIESGSSSCAEVIAKIVG